MLVSSTYGRLLEPGLRKIFFDSYRELPEQFSQVFKVQNSDKAVETDYRMGAFGLFEVKESGGSIKYDDPTRGLPLQYIHEEYAKGFTVERKLIKDAMYNQINKMPAKFGIAARATVEKVAAKVLIDAFTVNGFDGKPLISTTHMALNDKTVINNRLSTAFGATAADAALSDKSIKAALTQAATQKNDAGILVQCKPSVLVVPPALANIAETIVGSPSISMLGNGTLTTNVSNASSEKNIVGNKIKKVVVMDYLSADQGGSDTAWYVIDPTVAELNFFWREKLEFANENDFDTMQAKYRAYMRFSVGYSDFRGIVGSLGTGAA
jgi:phage major head subunit gpT-like protein